MSAGYGWPYYGLAPGDWRHGTTGGYSNHGCRCDDCTTANRLALRAWRRRQGLRSHAEYTAQRRAAAAARDYHGTEYGYLRHGCRCTPCRTAATAARQQRRNRAKEAA